MGIGWTQPALDRCRTCTVCIPFQSVLGPHRTYVPVVKVVPIWTETVRKPGLKWYANSASTASV